MTESQRRFLAESEQRITRECDTCGGSGGGFDPAHQCRCCNGTGSVTRFAWQASAECAAKYFELRTAAVHQDLPDLLADRETLLRLLHDSEGVDAYQNGYRAGLEAAKREPPSESWGVLDL